MHTYFIYRDVVCVEGRRYIAVAVVLALSDVTSVN